jgi:hypothetical protein
MASRRYHSFRDFYPFYLSEHSRSGTRRLHFAGTLLVLLTLAYALATRRWGFLALLPVFGYGFAWVAHFAVERNRPARFNTRSTAWPATFACSPTWRGAGSDFDRGGRR